MKNRLHLVCISMATSLASAAANACETLALAEHTVDPALQESDQRPPARVQLELVELAPGNGSEYLTGAEYLGCPGDASASFRILVAEDDQTPPEQLGFRFILVDGELPAERMYFPREPVRAASGHLYVMWRVSVRDSIEPVDFTIAVVAVDLAGNEGPMSDPIRVQHPRVY